MNSWTLKQKYARLMDGEEGAIRKAWTEAATVCLAYPNAYRTGMSNLGYQVVYALLNERPDWICERTFLPDPGDEGFFSPGSIPLFSLESQRPLTDFDLLAFSVSFENDYPNILSILEMARIPLSSSQRGDRDPLVIGGGVALTLNPEPLAPFFDLFLLGEGEEMLQEFMDVFGAARRERLSREETLRKIQEEIPGAYVPSLWQVRYGPDSRVAGMEPVLPGLPGRVAVRRVREIGRFATEQVVSTAGTEFGEMFLTEVSRGCGRGCRFCAAGYLYRPPRFRPVGVLLPSIERGIAQGRKIGLLGTAVSDHPDLRFLCRAILERGGRAAIGSLRLDRLDGEMADLLAKSGVETVSLAPEAGTQRLRNVIRKGIDEDQILEAVEALIGRGISNLRLYFMTGLPTETDDDVEAIIELTRSVQHRALASSQGKRRFRRLTLSLNQFIPKPATPFQWHPLEDVRTVQGRIRRIVQAFRKERALTVLSDLPKWNYVQALLSLGDRRVADILLMVHRSGGNWTESLKAVNVNPDFYVYRRKEPDEILPWGFIDHGVSGDLLRREYRDALAGWTPPEGWGAAE
ncbi:MAG: radical SAM protein [Syntrophaceae bacterium]|nr:radical SAM protein [Syntrophaceae bacterium]